MGQDKWEISKEDLLEALQKSGWSVDKAAVMFNVPRTTLQYRLHRHELMDLVKENRKKLKEKIDLQVVTEEPQEIINAQFWKKKAQANEKELAYVRNMRESLFDLGEPKTRLPNWTNKPHKASTDIPVLFTSDFQWGEVIDPAEMGGFNAFDLTIAKARYRQLIGSTIDICHNFRQGKYPGIVYLRGGDSVSGDIHDELQRTNEVPSTGQVLDLFGEELRGIQLLQEAFGKVAVVSVPGNHGRLTRKPIAKKYAEWNFDNMVSLMLEKAINHKDVTFLTPPSGEAFFSLYGQNFLLTHGDNIGSRGGTGYIGPIATIIRGVSKTKKTYAQMGMHADWILVGHFHTSAMGQDFIANGSLPGFNEYAFKIKATPEPPSQTLFFVNKKYGLNECRRIVLSDETVPDAEWFAE